MRKEEISYIDTIYIDTKHLALFLDPSHTEFLCLNISDIYDKLRHGFELKIEYLKPKPRSPDDFRIVLITRNWSYIYEFGRFRPYPF
jgi:hypothetical protein